MRIFDKSDLKKLYQPPWFSSGEENGQVTIIGGSSLFHGASLLALKTASRMVDMVFFASPEPSVGKVAEKIKSQISSFIWVPWDEIEDYIKKSDAVLIGNGFMRFRQEGNRAKLKDPSWCDRECRKTKEISEKLLTKFPNKKWVVDAGSLQVISPDILPKGSVITPNKKEFEMLFGLNSFGAEKVRKIAEKYKIIIVLKGVETIVASPTKTVIVKGGNPGLTKGGTGDVQAGLTVALLAQNDSFLAASAAAYLIKKAGDELLKKVGVNYNADDLAAKIPEVLGRII